MERLWEKITTGIAVTLVILLLFVLGSGLWAVRSLFPLLGAGFFADTMFILACIPFAICGGVWVWYHRGKYIANDPNGGYLQKGKQIIPLAPLAVLAPKLGGSTSVSEQPLNIPRLGELIRDGLLIKDEEGTPLMLQGFRMDGTPRYGTWPGVIGVAGMQNVGKSVTIETLVIIALMQGARVIVCDTHYMKARSLYKKLSALEGWITFAKTEKEVAAHARQFSQELHARKQGSEVYPYVFVMDEMASLMRSSIKGDIVTIIEEGSQEGHGYEQHIVLAIHDFSQDGMGDARIRDFLNWIYCHRLQAGQSKFIEAFNARKTKQTIAGLPAGHTVAKDEVNEVEYLIMPYGDSKDALAARKVLEQLRPLQPAYTPPRVQEPPRRAIPEQVNHWPDMSYPTAAARRDVPEIVPETDNFNTETLRFNQAETPYFSEETSVNTTAETGRFTSKEEKMQAIARLRCPPFNFNQSRIIQEIWHIKPGGSADYQRANAEYKELLEELVRSRTR